MGFDRCDDPSKHGCGHDMYLIKKDETPLSRRKELHHLLRIVRAVVRIRDHRVGRDDDTALRCELSAISIRSSRI